MAQFDRDLANSNRLQLNRYGDDTDIVPSESGITVLAIRISPQRSEDLNPGQHAAIWLLAADCFDRPVRGDSVTFKGYTYLVHDVKDDGGGGLTLSLDENG